MFFLEKESEPFAKLERYCASIKDITIEAKNATLEDSIPAILNFVKSGGPNSFPFVFIDPKGWTGFSMDTIAPLLRLDPGEVLINFMTSHIRRFLESPQDQTQESFEKLFGSREFKNKIEGLATRDREDAAVEEYQQNLKRMGHFDFVCAALVLQPDIASTFFHLIYATRNQKGVEVFKAIEKHAMAVQESTRAKIQQVRRVKKGGGQLELMPSDELHDASYYNSLRQRYLWKSKNSVQEALQTHGRLLYDHVWVLANSQPLTWDADLKDWIKSWEESGRLEIEGMLPRQRVPRLKSNNYLIWK